MPKFPFQCLPVFIQILILRGMETNTLLLLGTLSKKMRKVIRHANVYLNTVSISLDYQNTVIRTRRWDTACNRFEDYDIHSDVMCPMVAQKPLTDFSEYWSSITLPDLVEERKRLMKHFFGLFSTGNVSIFFGEAEMKSCYIWEILGSIPVQFFYYSSRVPPLPYTEILFLFNEMDIEEITISGAVAPDQFQTYTEGFTNNVLKLEYQKWFHFDSILNCSCKEIELLSAPSEVTSNHVNSFIKKWLLGGLQRIEMLKVTLTRHSFKDKRLVSNYYDECLVGITTEKHDEKRRPEELKLTNTLGAKDIRREDGATATVLFEYSNQMPKFFFHVWPTKEKVHLPNYNVLT